MSNTYNRARYRRLVVPRSKQVDHPFYYSFSHNGNAGVQLIRVLWGSGEFVDRPHERIGLPKKAKIRFSYMCENGNLVVGKQIRISRGETEKEKAELLREIAIKLRDILKLDTYSTFIKPLGMYIYDIYIMDFFQVSPGTIQVTLGDGIRSLRLNRTKPIPSQLTDDWNGSIMHVNNLPAHASPVINLVGVSSTAAHLIRPTPPGCHVLYPNPTDDYRIGAQPAQLSGTFLQVPVASTSGLPTDNASPYTANHSHSVLQPIGRGDCIPGDPSVHNPHNGGAQGSPGYGNGGHEQPPYYMYWNAEQDLLDFGSWPSNDQDADSTDGASSSASNRH